MQQTAKFSGLFDNIIQAATTILPFVAGNTQGNTPRFDIFGAIDQLLIQTNQLEVGFAALNSQQRLAQSANALQAIDQITQALNGLPPCRETACDYLASAKTTVSAVKNHIQQMITQAQQGSNTPTTTTPTTTPTPTNQTPVTLPNGQVVYVATPTNQTDNSQLLLYGGIGLAVLLLLKS
jgi:hypothetical protein